MGNATADRHIQQIKTHQPLTKMPENPQAKRQVHRLPPITHRQFLILDLIGDKQNVPGAEIRKGLLSYGEANTSPSFYQSMKRLEDARYVIGQYEFSIAKDSLDRDGCVREKTYCLTAEGRKVHDECLEFYRSRANNK